MQGFSATDAAFEGFRVARERPRAVAAWILVSIAMTTVQSFMAATLGGEAINDLMQAAAAGVTDPQKLAKIYAELAPFALAFMPIALLFYAVSNSAIFRVVLEPQTQGTALRLGPQEFRQFALLIIMGVVMFLVNLGLLFVTLSVAALAIRISSAVGGLVAALASLGWAGGLVYFLLRLSLAGPQTFAERRIRPFGSWHLTNHHIWPVAGTYLLAFIFSIIVLILGSIVLAGVIALTGQSVGQVLKPETTLAGYFAPIRVVYLIGWAAITTLSRTIIVSPSAVIYRHLKAQDRDA
jgi:hypothetical protein